MKISRHARNNMRLYGISLREIETTVQAPEVADQEGRYQIALKSFPGRFGSLPVKVVYIVNGDPVVITAYPLRQVRWRKNT